MEPTNSIGHSLSMISLKIKRGDPNTPDCCIGRIKIPLRTLLNICTGEEGISLVYDSINEISHTYNSCCVQIHADSGEA